MNGRTVRAGRLMCLALAVGLLGACASVPTSGPIEQGPVVDLEESTQFIRVIAAPPSAGAEPAEIVRGFLESHVSLEHGYAIARRYLTAKAAASWRPEIATAVYDEGSLQIEARKNRVRVTFDVVAELQADGTLLTVDPPDARKLSVSLEQVTEGDATVPQWRITDPPDGVLISSADLRRAYRLHETYFTSRRTGILVPDGRMLPVVGPALPTALAERVLAGPSEWLAPGVAADLPAGTTLALGAVPVSDGIARVELTEEALSATESQRRSLAAELTWTLTDLPGVTAVRLLVAGEPFEVPGAPSLLTRQVWQSQAPDAETTGVTGEQRAPLYLLDEAAIVRVAGKSRTTTPVPAEVPDSLQGLAVALDQRRAAAIQPDGSALWLLPLDRTVSSRRVAGEQITSASFDVDGQVWFTDTGGVAHVGGNGDVAAVPVTTEGSGARSAGEDLGPISALSLARDGTRIAIVVGGQVYVGVMVRSDDGLLVSSVHRIATQVSGIVDLAWRDASTLDLLGELAGGGRQVLRVSVGSGQTMPQGAPADPVDVAAAPNAVTMVATSGGAVFGNVGLQWREQERGRSAAYPG